MKLAVIAPTPLLQKYCRTAYHLALAHMMADRTYTDFYRNDAEGYVILDNSVMELGESVTRDFLVKAIEYFDPDELVLPDVPYDADATYENAKQMAPYFKDLYPNVRLMAVPQGEDVYCWTKDMYRYLQVPEIDTIGIPKHRKDMRLYILDAINKDRPSNWSYHLLGTWGSGAEVQHVASLFPWVRGVDTKLPVRLGQLGIAMSPMKGMLFDGRDSLPQMDLNNGYDPFPVITNYNCLVMKAWANGEVKDAEGPLGGVRHLSVTE